MRILIVNPFQVFYAHSPSVPLGSLAVASYLTQLGHSVRLCDRCIKRENMSRVIKDFAPDAVGVSFMSFGSITDGLSVAQTAKEHGIPVIAGGNCASAVYGDLLKEESVKYVVIGEGEVSFAQALEVISGAKEPDEVEGIAYMKNGKLIKNADRAFSDLSDFPLMDWSLVDPKKYFQHYIGCSKMLYIYSGKGCPGQCSFCYNKQYSKCRYRSRPPEYVVEEIKYLIENHGLNGVYFSDELWYPKKELMREFCQRVKESGLSFVWGCQTRVDVFGKEELQQMYDSGCRWIFYGVESGSPEVLSRMNKGIDLQQAQAAISLCSDIGITTIASFIIGYIGETQEELKETVSFANKLNANISVFSILTPFPKTDVFDYAVANNILTPAQSAQGWAHMNVGEYPIYRFSEIPDIDLVVVRNYFRWKSFTSKTSSCGSSSFTIMKKSIADELKNILTHGPYSFFVGLYFSSREFISVFWYSHAYKRVLSRYGLTHRK